MSNEIPPSASNPLDSVNEVQTQSSNTLIVIADEEQQQLIKKRKLTSRAWEHFTKKTVKGQVKAECRHYKKLLGGETWGRCSCNSNVNCDPLKLGPDNGGQPCKYHSVISEFTANGTTSRPSSATRDNPYEVRRIFTMGLPFSGHHAGQILFGLDDGYLYFMMGDSGSQGDPCNISQNKKSLLGKIMRLDIDNIASAGEITELDLWGNYSIPRDNPSLGDKDMQPGIWALGFRNPWRCSFDS
ncbi:hypothetical protein GIB67_016420 [Kingdonia uniflora]|uniref:Glucose/Sorbosone dehydrogenase domain-containing protein n=1 Tax=Kingdonia uniflora TaxID=39325 RepID=A0A7J7MHF2_9MAGN|nr:hypothetical protein GIB67_016420 [Kingdonia uniflora]